MHKNHYKLYCRILSKVILAAKQLHYNNCIKKSRNKSKTTWSIVKTITNKRNPTNNILTINVNNKLYSNPLTIANSHFLSLAENIIRKNSSQNNTSNNTDPMTYLHKNFGHISSQMKLRNTTMQQVNKIINLIKCKDSAGYDEISSRILKKSAPYILSPLIFICNKILSTGIFPERLKFAEVKLLLKKGDPTDFSNYRPISILTSFSKVIEKIIYKRLYYYLIDNKSLVKEQMGFWENYPQILLHMPF